MVAWGRCLGWEGMKHNGGGLPELGPHGVSGTEGALAGSGARQGMMGLEMQLWHAGINPLTIPLGPVSGKGKSQCHHPRQVSKRAFSKMQT